MSVAEDEQSLLYLLFNTGTQSLQSAFPGRIFYLTLHHKLVHIFIVELCAALCISYR